MYTDKFLLSMLNNPDEEIKQNFFGNMNCNSCPLLYGGCHDGIEEACEVDIRNYLYAKGLLPAEAGEPTAESTPTEDEPAAANTEEEEMSMRELTNLHKEIHRKYIIARDKAFVKMVEEMYNTGNFYTAEDLSDMSGLSVNTIANTFTLCRRYYYQRVIRDYYLETKKTWLRTPFVRLLPTGEVDMSRHNDQCREVLSYKIVKR
jgi:hypothetical protein